MKQNGPHERTKVQTLLSQKTQNTLKNMTILFGHENVEKCVDKESSTPNRGYGDIVGKSRNQNK